MIDNCLRNIKDVYLLYQPRIDALEGEKKQSDLLCELNVIEQVYNVCHTTIVQKAWKTGQDLTVHGWIYSVDDGILKDLDVCIADVDEISQIQQMT